MNPEIKKKWVDALRSGKYVQGYGALRSKNNEYCCLGVLCDLNAKDIGKDWYLNDDQYEYDSRTGTLSQSVADWAGLSICPRVPTAFGMLSLSRLNDDEYSFDEIANLIQEQL